MSSMPAVAFADGEFDPADWRVSAIDYAEDCDRRSATSSSFKVLSYPMIEHGMDNWKVSVWRP